MPRNARSPSHNSTTRKYRPLQKPLMTEREARIYLRDFPTKVAIESGLPGGGDGPQDAFRHLIFAAEMVRLYGNSGSAVAQLRETGAWAK